jgi:photosystem II stability/assembly factor-like uncharacterized protein
MFKKLSTLLAVLVLGVSLTGCITINSNKPAAEVAAKLGVFATPDRGDNWLAKTKLLTTGAPASIAGVQVSSLALDPLDMNAIYLGTKTDGLFYSYNAGDAWQKATSLASQKGGTGRIYAITVDPKNKCNVYASVENKVWKSTDCSRSWSAIFTAATAKELVAQITIDWSNPAIVYILSNNGAIYKSTNFGAGWARMADLKNTAFDLVLDRKNSQTLYITSFQNGLYKSTNGGVDWENLAKNMKDFKSSKTGYGLIATKNGSLLYLSKFGLLKSADGGASWIQVKLFTAEGAVVFKTFSVDPNNDNNIYITDATQMYRSQNGGDTWEPRRLPSSSIPTALKVHSKDGNIIYLGFMAPEKKN